MHCNEAKRQLDALGDIENLDMELAEHLRNCDDCHEYARERQLIALLASLPVRQPAPGFEDRVIRKALAGTAAPEGRLHVRWALATAASVIVAVLLTLQFYPIGSDRGPAGDIRAAVVEAQPQQTRMVNVRFNSPRELNDARITVQLDDNLALDGYEGVHHLQWQATLKNGDNRLSLPIQLIRGQSGRVTITVEHGNASKRFSVLVNAAPDNGGQKLSMA